MRTIHVGVFTACAAGNALAVEQSVGAGVSDLVIVNEVTGGVMTLERIDLHVSFQLRHFLIAKF